MNSIDNRADDDDAAALPAAGKRPMLVDVCEVIATDGSADLTPAALRARQQRFHNLLQATGDGLWERNLISGATYTSPRWRELLGYAQDDPAIVDGQIDQHVHPEDRVLAADALGRHLQTREPYRIDCRLRTKEGNYGWFTAYGQATWNASGQAVLMTGALRDITERKESEDELARHKRFYAALQQIRRTVIAIKNRDSLLDALCRIAIEHGHFRLAWIGLIDPHTSQIEPVAAQGSSHNVMREVTLPIYEHTSTQCELTADTIRTGEHAIVNDVLVEPRLANFKEIALATGIRAMASFPVREAERVVGVLNLYGDASGHFNEPLIMLLNEMAMDISFALDNLRRERGHRALERALVASEEQFRQLTSNIPDALWIVDAHDKRVLYVSPAYQRIWGRSPDDLHVDKVGWLDSVHPADLNRVRANFDQHLTDFDEEYRVLRPDGSIRWVHSRVFPVADQSGNVERLTGIAQDITDRRDYEARLQHLAHFDGLTGLPNRLLFQDRLKQTLAHAERAGDATAVMLIDIDRFKLVNETLGHAAGDALLQEVAMRLSRAVRAIDTVARLGGGDEFAVMLCELRAIEDAVPVAQQIMAAFEQPFDIEGNEVFTTLSIGISSFPADSDNSDALLRNADIAMYRAKELGCGRFQFYAAEMNARSLERVSLGNHLRRAMERNEFSLQYQPKAELSTGAITGVEALLRWNSPELGSISPARFIPILEDNGHIVRVGEWVLSMACRQIRTWTDQGIAPVPIAVNLSARQLQQPDLDVRVKAILDEHGVHPSLIELEITESVLMEQGERITTVLQNLKATGIRLAIDDFGTGYSSLSYLKSFPLDTLKVDRSFIMDVVTDVDAALITRAVISMAANLRLRVVAEGVETKAQLAFLTACGCDEMQGYYFSYPLAADDCTKLLVNHCKLPLPATGKNEDGRTLLLVDDEVRVMSALKRVLRRDGYRILTAASATEALEILACHKIAVVVADQRMPEMTGVEFLRRVKDLYPDAVRIMLSGYTDFHSIADAINRGSIYKFLTKPWDDQQLRENVGEAFRRYDLTIENERLRNELRAIGGELPTPTLPPATAVSHSEDRH